MSKKQTLIRGAFILTITGFATRFMGFFYRIFLSHTFGEENVGLYQLIFPVYALCISLTCAGIETALSRTVAQKTAEGNEKEAKLVLLSGLTISLTLSISCTLLLQRFAPLIATTFLQEARCESLLILISYALPFSAVHSCICGYCLGKSQTKLPALSQLIEQCIRISSVFLLYLATDTSGKTPSIALAVSGLIFGEMAASLFVLWVLNKDYPSCFQKDFPLRQLCVHMKKLILFSAPLTGNRILLNLLQSVEAISIPIRLQQYGMTGSEALSTYGVLTGMALPCILFPSAISNSISTMLIPAVAEVQAVKNEKELNRLIGKTVCSCFLLGAISCSCFLLLGNWAGNFLFHSPLAGKFIVTLAWTCPFLYTNSALISIIHGLGKTQISFLINSFGLLLRIAGVFFAIPIYGILGYLWGLLGSQLAVTTLCAIFVISHQKHV